MFVDLGISFQDIFGQIQRSVQFFIAGSGYWYHSVRMSCIESCLYDPLKSWTKLSSLGSSFFCVVDLKMALGSGEGYTRRSVTVFGLVREEIGADSVT